MVSPIHSTDIKPIYIGKPWPYRVIPNDSLGSGHLVYLIASQSGLYGWGYITKIELYEDVDLLQEMMNILVTRPVVHECLVSFAEINQDRDLKGIFEKLNGNFVELTPKQANSLNDLIRSHGAEAPPDVSEIQDRIGKFGVKDTASLHAKLSLAVRNYNLASVLFMDLDNFKSVNDDYDHATGDQVIREALDAVQNVIQDRGELFHRSGDEMIVLLPNIKDAAAREVAERIRGAIEQKYFSVIGQGYVTTTIGLATYPDTCKNWEELERIADQTAMRAKKIRKNRVANCLEKFVSQPTVSKTDLVNAQREMRRLDLLNEGRPMTHVDILKTKRQKISILEKLAERLKSEGRTAAAWKLKRMIHTIELEGGISTPFQEKLEKILETEDEITSYTGKERRSKKRE